MQKSSIERSICPDHLFYSKNGVVRFHWECFCESIDWCKKQKLSWVGRVF